MQCLLLSLTDASAHAEKAQTHKLAVRTRLHVRAAEKQLLAEREIVRVLCARCHTCGSELRYTKRVMSLRGPARTQDTADV
eukprot:173360-Pleurochrysis_carterae.AAC.1